MNLRHNILVGCFFFVLVISNIALAQNIPAGFPVLEENLRREQLLGTNEIQDFSFGLRPIVSIKQNRFNSRIDSFSIKEKKVHLEFLPVLSTTVLNSNRPFGWGNFSMMNGAGVQTLISPGVYGRVFIFKFQFRPEYVASQNKGYQGFGNGFSSQIIKNRFRLWNFGDYPERFSKEYNSFVWWGQSFVSLNAGPIELGASTQNIWWGPGQFNSLIFSNNARGMKHLFLRTTRPINVFIGHIESQIIAARAEDSGILPSQNQQLNSEYALPFTGDWRYVSGINIMFQPVILPGLFLGFSRTFQQYNEMVEDSFRGRLPIFEGFQKKKFFTNENSVEYDGKGQDQQVALSIRYFSSKANFDLYAEYGRRDHSYDWRDFILSPEHARAYLLGFTKLIKTGKKNVFYQASGEIVHQQESVNRYIRYEFLNTFNASWHTHYQARGFSNEGQAMGVGIGTGANLQMLELARISGLNKFGVLFQRLENQQDFFYGSFAENPNKRPWIDFSFGLLYDKQWGNLILSTKTQIIRGVNYQWNNSSQSSMAFPLGQKLWTFSGKVNIIYQLHK